MNNTANMRPSGVKTSRAIAPLVMKLSRYSPEVDPAKKGTSEFAPAMLAGCIRHCAGSICDMISIVTAGLRRWPTIASRLNRVWNLETDSQRMSAANHRAAEAKRSPRTAFARQTERLSFGKFLNLSQRCREHTAKSGVNRERTPSYAKATKAQHQLQAPRTSLELRAMRKP